MARSADLLSPGTRTADLDPTVHLSVVLDGIVDGHAGRRRCVISDVGVGAWVDVELAAPRPAGMTVAPSYALGPPPLPLQPVSLDQTLPAPSVRAVPPTDKTLGEVAGYEAGRRHHPRTPQIPHRGG